MNASKENATKAMEILHESWCRISNSDGTYYLTDRMLTCDQKFVLEFLARAAHKLPKEISFLMPRKKRAKK